MTEPAVEVTALSKDFKMLRAVDNISFRIDRGVTCGLLGANGAGKTTTLAMLLGLLLPTQGQISLLGVDFLKHRYQVLPRINFSSPYVDLPQRLTVFENLMVYARLYGIPQAKKRIAAVVDELDCARLLKREYRTLSAGQKTRIGIAKALLNQPELLLLDEPTASLDPDTADRIRTYLQHYQQRTGATILLASHNMLEVERICTQVIIMRSGVIVDEGTPDALIAKYGRDTMEEVFLHITRNQENDEEGIT